MKFISTILSLTLLSLAVAILPEKCSVAYCGAKGALARCTQTHPFEVTNCGAWSATNEAHLQCRALDCRFMSCYFIPVRASDGKLYCTSCHIHEVGCKTGFKVYGPVDGAVTRPVAEDVETEKGAEVIEVTTSRDIEEKKVSTGPEDSVSRDIIGLPVCSMSFCTKRGAKAQCRFTLPKSGTAIITCLKFSFTAQSRKQCSFFCPFLCLPAPLQPIANTGEKFCTKCLLRQESCRTRYRTFGPVTPPMITPKPVRTLVVPTCSVPFCTASGRSANCLLYGKKRATCADYAKTENKEKACSFFCIQICVDPDEAPVDNFGKKYCSVCHLRQASCRSDFKIFLVLK